MISENEKRRKHLQCIPTLMWQNNEKTLDLFEKTASILEEIKYVNVTYHNILCLTY